MRDETYEKANEIIESFENCYGGDGILLLTPRDIREAVIDRENEYTDNAKMEEIVTKWHREVKEGHIAIEGRYPTDTRMTQDEKHRTLMVTKKTTHKYLDYLTENNPRVKKSMCKIEEYRENMEHLIEIAFPTSDTLENKLFKILEEAEYNIIREPDGYPYYSIFIREIMSYELFLCIEITPYKNKLISFNRYKHKPSEEIWLKRLSYYKKIGERNKYRHMTTIHSEKWAIPFDKFSKLYRKILSLSNKAITKPLK